MGFGCPLRATTLKTTPVENQRLENHTSGKPTTYKYKNYINVMIIRNGIIIETHYASVGVS